MQETSEKSKKARKRLIIESIAIFFIISSPFIFKAHDYFSRDPDATVNFLGFTIDSNGFKNLNVYMWYLVGKIIPFYLLLIWFFTCKHWWYHILLIPICMYAFQLFEVVVSEDDFIDTENILWLLPVCMVVIPFVYFVRVKLYDKHVHGIDLEAMDAELKYYKDKERSQLEKAGIKVNIEKSIQEDLSQETPNKALGSLLTQLRHSLRSLFNFFF